MNAREYITALNKLDASMKANVKQAITIGCELIENDAKHRVPVDTGLLRNSITHDVREEGNTIVGVVGTNFDYAPYVEYGTGLFAEAGDGRQTPWSYQDADGNWHTTVGQHPQPYLRPAFDANIDAIKQTIEDIINGVIR